MNIIIFLFIKTVKDIKKTKGSGSGGFIFICSLPKMGKYGSSNTLHRKKTKISKLEYFSTQIIYQWNSNGFELNE